MILQKRKASGINRANFYYRRYQSQKLTRFWYHSDSWKHTRYSSPLGNCPTISNVSHLKVWSFWPLVQTLGSGSTVGSLWGLSAASFLGKGRVAPNNQPPANSN